MEILIRQGSDKDNAEAIRNDLALDVKTLHIGSAPEQQLQLVGTGVLPQHAEITRSRGNVKISTRRGAVILVNGQEGKSFNLTKGDIVEVGGNIIEVVATPTGFDFAIDVSRSSASEATAYEQAYKTDLAQTMLAPRLLAWVLCTIVLAMSLAIPLAHHFLSRSDSSIQAAGISWPISDTVWSSGPLHEAHASLDESCNSCHEKLFEKVTDESCQTCHNDSPDHIQAVAANQHLQIDINGRCASCHREHNEPVSSLVITRNSLCVDCHAGHDLQTETYALERIEDFGVGSHKPFQVSLLRPPEGGSYDTADKWSIERIALEGATESSQLKFDHEVHYDTSKVKLNGDSTLTCAHCHELSVDGEYFEDIEFEQNCANSGCHELDLDPRNRLPHGLPDVTVAAIQGYYLRKFGNPDQVEATPARERRRVLDRDANEDTTCSGSAYDCALELAARKIEQQFTVTGCVTCHTINDAGGEVLDRYQVAVVKLNKDYLANARFDHQAHGVLVEPGLTETLTGDDSCVYCHDAPASSFSNDVLIPAISNCTTCHNGPERKLNVPLGCIDCHAYHRAL